MGAIEFATPEALWGLALAAPIIALHLYHRRRRRVDVAFLPLIREGSGATSPFGGFRKLADAASLMVRLLALAALVGALAGPRPVEAGGAPEDLVIVIDADPTTRAKEPDGTTRFEHAIRLAKAHIAARTGGTVAVLIAGEAPRIVVAPTEDRGAAVKALDGMWPGWVKADLDATVALAVGGRPDGRPYSPLGGAHVIALTSRPYEAPAGVEVLGIGTATDDQGFVDQFVGPAADGIHTTVRWTIRNFSDEPKTRRIMSKIGEQALEPREVAMPARGTADVTLDLLPPRDGALFLAHLEGEDALTTNDATGAWLAAVPRPSILVVHGGQPRAFVTAFLDATGDGIDREASGSVPAADFTKATKRDVVIIDGVSLPKPMKAGAALYLAPYGDGAGLPFTLGRAVKEPLVWRTDPSHPLLRGVDLSTAFVAKGTTITGDGVRGLAFVEGEPIVAEGETGGARWIAFGLDPDGSDLAIRAALPILLKNAVHRLGVPLDRPRKPFYRRGERIVGVLRGAADGGDVPAIGIEPPEFATGEAGFADVDAWLGAGSLMSIGSMHAALVDLDPDRDIRPARTEAVPPPPAAVREDAGEVAGRWRFWLLAGAAALLLLDLAMARGGAKKVAVAAKPG